MSDEIRPYSVAWYRMQQLQSKTFGANPTESGFPDAVASTGLKNYDQASYYPADVLVYRGGSLFKSNTAIPANTPFSEGPGAQQWTNVSESKTSIPHFDAADEYNTDEPVTRNEIIFRCKEDGVTGAWDRTKWERISQPPARVFLEAGDSASIVLEGYKTQEIIFADARTVGGFSFNEGDRIMLRKDLTGSMAASDFYYFPVTTAELPTAPTQDNDVTYQATIGDDISIFYTIDMGTEIELGKNIADRITWDNTTDPGTTGSIVRIEYYSAMETETKTLTETTDYTVRNGKFFTFPNIGLEENDTLTVVYRT